MSKDYPYTRQEAIHKMVAGKLMQAKWQVGKEHYLYEGSQVTPFLLIDRQGKICDNKISTDCEEWRIYKEPKKMVEKWLWIVKDSAGEPLLTRWFYSEEQRRVEYEEVDIICRADWSRIEVSE